MAVVNHQSIAALPQQVPNYTFPPHIDAGTPIASAHLYAACADFSKMVALQRQGIVGEEDVNAAIQRVEQIASQHAPLESSNGSPEGKSALIPCAPRHMEERTIARMNTIRQDIKGLTEGLAGEFEKINIKIRNDRARAWNRKVVDGGHGQLSLIAKEEQGTGAGLPGVVAANGVGNLNIYNLAIGAPNFGPTTIEQLNNPNFLNVGILSYLSIAYDDSFGINQGDTVETMGEKFKTFMCIGNAPL